MATKAIQIPNNYTPRDYQLPFLQAFDNGCKRLYLIWHRRAGKDKTCFALVAKEAAQRVGAYYYVFPTYKQGKKALWDNRDASGFRTLEHVPKELWESENSVEMKLTLKNGSIIQVVGSTDVDSLVGTNPVGIVFSEWALQNPNTLDYLQPIVEENNGWMIFNTTPRGDNHAKQLYEIAKDNDSWFASLLTSHDTKVFTERQLKEIKVQYQQRHGDDAIYQQELFCSFDTPLPGAIFGEQMKRLEQEGKVGKFEYDRSKPVYTAWDLGAGDATAIWFFQVSGNTKTFIDYHTSFGGGMKFYFDLIMDKGYTYREHFLPHDADAIVQGQVAKTRKEMLVELGLQGIKVIPRVRFKQDAIEMANLMLPNCRFNKDKCKDGIIAMKEYARKWDDGKKAFSAHPDHNWASHAADAFITIAQGFYEGDQTDDFDPNLLVEPTYDTW